MGFDYKTTAKFRDIIRELIAAEVKRINPPKMYGQIVSIDYENSIAWVLMPGDTEPIPIPWGGGSAGDVVNVDGGTTIVDRQALISWAQYYADEQVVNQEKVVWGDVSIDPGATFQTFLPVDEILPPHGGKVFYRIYIEWEGPPSEVEVVRLRGDDEEEEPLP